MMRLTRSSMLEVLRQDYIRTARAKGASYAKVNFVHALRNAVLPIVTIVGIEAAFLVGGLIVTETVFNIPGVARFLVEAIRSRDYPIVQNLVMFIAVVRGVDQFSDRHGLSRARSAHRVREMMTNGRSESIGQHRGIDTAAPREPACGRSRFYARRYPLGAAGAVIVTAVRADGDLRAVDHAVRSDAAPIRASRSRAPGGAHPLGADFMGRDMWSRIVYGARISLAVGIGSTGLGCLFGVTIGLTSGYFGGWYDLIVQRVMDMMQSLPLLVMALVMTAALGPSLENTIIAIAIPLVPTVARVIRSNTLMLREMPFVEAARAVGMNEFAIALRHVLPNTLAPLIVLATAQLGSTILVEAALSFLGLGVPEPHPSWGRMLSESAAEYVRVAPWLVIFPGAAISLAVFGTNLLGDALRDILDPRQRD